MSSKKRKTKGTPDSVDIHVGKRLKVRRSLLGISQEKLATSSGVTFQQIQKYEHGMNRISAGRLYLFSKILKVPISYFFEHISDGGDSTGLFGFADQGQEDFDYREVTQDKETLNLIRAYYAIEDSDLRKEILRFCKIIGEKTGGDKPQNQAST